MQRIAVIGTGTMAGGIVQTFIQHGYEVLLCGRSQQSLDLCIATVQKALNKLVSKDKIQAADAEQMMSRLTGRTGINELDTCQLIIETVAEKVSLKSEMMMEIDRYAAPDAIIATNTSSLSLEALASKVQRPEQFIGMHFFNPVPMMKLVEVVSGLRTSEETRNTIVELAKSLGKNPVEVKDSPGFVVNRVLFPMINEAAFALQEGVADAAGIDASMQAGCNHPIGPLALADLVGLDVVVAILKSLQTEFGNPRYAPCLELVKRVEAGYLGRKTGQGFYDYS